MTPCDTKTKREIPAPAGVFFEKYLKKSSKTVTSAVTGTAFIGKIIM